MQRSIGTRFDKTGHGFSLCCFLGNSLFRRKNATNDLNQVPWSRGCAFSPSPQQQSTGTEQKRGARVTCVCSLGNDPAKLVFHQGHRIALGEQRARCTPRKKAAADGVGVPGRASGWFRGFEKNGISRPNFAANEVLGKPASFRFKLTKPSRKKWRGRAESGGRRNRKKVDWEKRADNFQPTASPLESIRVLRVSCLSLFLRNKHLCFSPKKHGVVTQDQACSSDFQAALTAPSHLAAASGSSHNQRWKSNSTHTTRAQAAATARTGQAGTKPPPWSERRGCGFFAPASLPA